MNENEIVKITKDTLISELIAKHEEVVEVLIDYGLHCVGCPLNNGDTIEMGAKIHGISNSEISEMVDRINEVIEFKE